MKAKLLVYALRLKVDVIVVEAQVTAGAAMNATKTIPIVMMGIGVDPVDVGLVASLARTWRKRHRVDGDSPGANSRENIARYFARTL
jgi:hypothetical protein